MKRKLQAQRKFAHGAFVPSTPDRRQCEQPISVIREPTSTREDIKNIYHNNMSAERLLDLVSLQNVHKHRTPVVVLERLQPEAVSNANTKPRNIQQISLSSFEHDNVKRAKHGMCLRSKRHAVKGKRFIKKALVDSKNLINSKGLTNKRKRIIPCEATHKKQHIEHIGSPSDFSNEDDKPLKYFANTASKIVTARSEKPFDKAPKVDVSNKLNEDRPTQLDVNGDTENADIDILCSQMVEEMDTKNSMLSIHSDILRDTETAMKSSFANEYPQEHISEGYYGVEQIENWLNNSIADSIPEPVLEVGFKTPPPPKTRLRDVETGVLRSGECLPRPLSPSDTLLPMLLSEDTLQHNPTTQTESRTNSPCPSERFTTLKDLVHAQKNDLEKRCKNNCEQCNRVDKVVKVSSMIRNQGGLCGNTTEDIYEFKAEAEGAIKSSGLSEFRERLRNSKPARSIVSISSDEDTEVPYYFDLLPSSGKIVQVMAVKVPDQQQRMMRARFVTKSKCKLNQSDCSLIKYDLMLDQLFKTLNVPCDSTNEKLSNTQETVRSRNSTEKLLENIDDLLNSTQTESFRSLDLMISEELGENVSNIGNERFSTNEVANDSVGTSNVVPENVASCGRSETVIPVEPLVALNTSSEKVVKKVSQKGGNTAENKPNVTQDKKPKSQKKVKKKPVPVNRNLRHTKKDQGSPTNSETAKLRDAPVFYPTAAEFKDPLAYFEKITPLAAKAGLCKVVAPEGFNPSCSVNDDIRFSVTNQYIARLYNRWGPAARTMSAIKAASNAIFVKPPLVEGVEVDLPKLYRTVQEHGGLNKVIEKKRWGRVCEQMRFTKGNNPEKKLDQIYVKYILPYATLSPQERHQYMTLVEVCWHKKNQRMLERALNPLHRQMRLLGEEDSSEDEADDEADCSVSLNEAEDCIVPGRRLNLASYKKVAAHVLYTYFPMTSDPPPEEVKNVYWRLILDSVDHVCVYTASIDTGEEGYGFTKNKNDPYGKHPWNLKMLSQNSNNILRSLHPKIGVTVPTLHLGMAFSTSCWHRDPHGLPWIEYMHEGPGKIWYGIADDQSTNFRRAVEILCPSYCQNKQIWLPSDITMIPPNLLIEHNVSLSSVVQNPREFIIVFPKAYSCSISTGFTISESVYFATDSWLSTVGLVFQELRDSCEPSMFSLEHLLISTALDSRVSLTVLQQVNTALRSVIAEELSNRLELQNIGIQYKARIPKKRPAGHWNEREHEECEFCRSTLYLSKVSGVTKRSSMCLHHALRVLKAKDNTRDVSTLDLTAYFSAPELENIMSKVTTRLTET